MRPMWLVRLALLLLAPGLAQAEDAAVSPAELGQIKSVIERQIAAFGRDDAATAFSFASPAIQHQFGSPETFMRMVETGYPQVYRPRSVRFGEAKRAADRVVQEVDVIGPDGAGARAYYLMEHERDGSWRINGVSLVPSRERET